MLTVRRVQTPGALRHQVRRLVLERFFVRWHMSLILAGVLLSGLAASKLLLFFGFAGLPWRYPLAVVFSYGVFFLCVRLWIAYAFRSSTFRLSDSLDMDPTDALEALDLLEGHPPTTGEPISGGAGGGHGGSASHGFWDAIGLDLDDGGLVLLLFILLLAAIFGSGLYLLYQAPAILSEAAFQAGLAAALARSSKRMEGTGWVGSVFAATWLPFLIVLVMAAVFGWAAHAYCPAATKLVEISRACASPS